MYIINETVFYSALKKKGYKTVGELAKSLGIHRNTIHHYLSGHGVFPEAFEKIVEILDLDANEVLIKKEEKNIVPYEPIVKLIDRLCLESPDVTFVLFGSRSKGNAKKYSDWDVGVYKAGGLSHDLYRKIVRKKNDLADDLPFFVDVVNLNNADSYFIDEAAKSWIFLTGSLRGFLELQRKVAM